jgi:CRISPR-associated endonuclease/helicase Cas3
MQTESAFQLWAKTGETADRWHSLPFHLLDVAACAEALWDTLPKAMQAHVCRWMGLESSEAVSTLAFLAGSHDIGKANRFFQAKATGHRDRLEPWNLYPSVEPCGHGQATYAILKSWLIKRSYCPKLQANRVAGAVGGHHGTFFSDESLRTLNVDSAPWQDAADELLDRLAQLYPPKIAGLEPCSANPFATWLAGFVSVSDWIGSHDRMVTFESVPRDLAVYQSQARIRARELIGILGFLSPSTGAPLNMVNLLPAGSGPNPMQRIADEVRTRRARLTIIEAPTGEGKTEAALLLADEGRAEGRGLFVALPTMATANGLLPRIDFYLSLAYGENARRARLLHGGAWLFDRPGGKVGDPGDTDEVSNVEDWFEGSKRGLLDHVGVGTIDQVLLAGLNAKHFFVRLFGLAGKTVILDEVHAYDVYMTRILEVVLAWLKALDCRVILLSATLPSARRRELLKAWGVEPIIESPYPRLTTITQTEDVFSESFSVRPRKPLRIQPWRLSREQQLEEAVGLLMNAAQATRGFSVLIVNSVKRAQEAYRLALEHSVRKDVDVCVFHARFTRTDRQVKEALALEKFGKHAQRGEPRLLIATQVVEQSLDLDFDYMVSDLAPVDLLIQRAGRLHRHARDQFGTLLGPGEPDMRSDPELLFLSDEGQADGSNSPRSAVYASAVLAATQEWLGEGQDIREPADIERAIESVYGKLDSRSKVSEHEAYGSLLTHYEEEVRKADKAAQKAVIRHPFSDRAVTLDVNRLSEDITEERHALAAKTRLETLPSIEIVIWPMTKPLPDTPLTLEAKRDFVLAAVRVSVPSSLLAEIEELPQPDAWRRARALKGARLGRVDDHGIFETAKHRFRYSSDMGLTWEKRDA